MNRTRFEEFLENQGIKEEWYEEYSNDNTTPLDTFFDGHEEGPRPKHYLHDSFLWSATKQGHDYWEAYHTKWMAICRRMIKLQERANASKEI